MRMNRFRAVYKSPTYKRDKGYAWFVLLMSSLSSSMHFGFTTAILGNLTLVHQSYFGVGLQLSSLIGTLHLAVIFFFGPVASVLVKKLGCRVTQVCGGIFAVLGVGLTFFAVKPWHAIVFFSILSSVGVSNVFVATSEILALNFNEYKYLAFSLAALVQKAGVIVNPIASQVLFDRFGYSKAMAIMSSFHVIHILAGIFFFQPKEHENLEGSLKEDVGERDTNLDKFAHEVGQSNKALDMNGEDDSKLHEKDIIDESRAGKIENGVDGILPIRSEGKTSDVRKNFKHLLCSPKIWAYLLNASMWNVNTSSFQVLLNDFVVHHIQLTEQEAAFGVTIAGAASIGGCVFIMLVSKVRVDRVIINFGCTLFLGIATIFIAFSSNKVMFYILAAVCGIGQGALIANLLGVITDMAGDVNRVALLLGLDLFAEGTGALGGTQLASFISDRAGEQYGIIFSGATALTASLALLPVMICRIRQRSK
ncbi:monocarboxylate transporter 3-like [Watersipora subatra]|uniref:monocarboxylate transporter 3-like n=1 Tax=Watersipora subatra TaxID=2589382 RepID=UPI00355C3D63